MNHLNDRAKIFATRKHCMKVIILPPPRCNFQFDTSEFLLYFQFIPHLRILSLIILSVYTSRNIFTTHRIDFNAHQVFLNQSYT